MITTFTCNREAAAKVCGFNGIDKTGKYVGIITQAELAESKGGATYLELVIKATRWVEKVGDQIGSEETGEKAAFVRLFLTSRDGQRTFNADILDALMTVLGIEHAEAKACKVFNRDNTSRPGYRIFELEKKEVGLLLQRENRTYVDQYGDQKSTHQMNIVTPYDVRTGRCAKEIIEGRSEGTIVDTRFKSLKDKEPKAAPTPAATSQTTPAGGLPYDDADAPF